jgi:putative spermidine/putrescine transport system substrate-binding protein
VRYASPKEGYRGWHGGIMLNKAASGKVLDACYAYLNWWLSGWAGAVVARQGYYFSIPENVKKYLTPAEWDYWYEGKPAAEDLKDPFGNVVVKKGEVRDGGSLEERVCKTGIAVWNTVMDEHQYLVTKWNEFLTA